jgi:DNA-binding transcriptional LysR family regulator
VIRRVDEMRAKARGMSGGMEAELSVSIDMMMPIEIVTQVAAAFAARFPATPLKLYTDSLGKVAERVLTGDSSLGVQVVLPGLPEELRAERIIEVRWVIVAAPTHPLAAHEGPIARQVMADHTQIILTDQTSYTQGKNYGVLSPSTWKMTDLNVKRAFLLAGLGWGGMPFSAVEEDLVAGRLVTLHSEDEPAQGLYVPMSVSHAANSLPGPAGQWFVKTLRETARAYGAAHQDSVLIAA